MKIPASPRKPHLTILFLALTINLAQAQVDHRPYQSPIRNQQGRGTCTAFAVVAAMETYPGVPTDLSEQFIYGWAKMEHYQEMGEYDQGAPLSFYSDILRNHGTISEEEMPYDPSAPYWADQADSFERMKADVKGVVVDLLRLQDYSFRLNWDLQDLRKGMQAKDIQWIKEQLDHGVKAIPVGYLMDSDYWSTCPATSDHMLRPEDFLIVKTADTWASYTQARKQNDNLTGLLLAGLLEANYADTLYAAREGHAVAIVGYNDQGFLIKNSWGEDWGESGYGWVSFDFHRLYCNELLLIRSMQFARGISGADNVWNPQGYQLKVTPYAYNNTTLKIFIDGAEMSLVWTGTGRPEALKEVTYRLKDPTGRTLEEKLGYVSGIFAGEGDKMGYPASGFDSFLNAGGAFTVEVQATSVSGKTFKRNFKVSGRQNRCYSS